MKRTTIWLLQEDRDAIESIKAKYGLATISATIRLALRVLASQKLEVGNVSNQEPQDFVKYKC